MSTMLNGGVSVGNGDSRSDRKVPMQVVMVSLNAWGFATA